MKVADLVSRLRLLDQDAQVLMSPDEEGNRIHFLFGIGPQKFVDYGHEINAIHPDDLEEYNGVELQDAVILWP